MSKTYRKRLINFCSNCHKPSAWTDAPVKGYSEYCTCGKNPYRWVTYSFYHKRVKCHDHKSIWKPDKDFKQMRRQQYRAQCKQALYNHVYKGKDYIPPVNKKGDVWDWN